MFIKFQLKCISSWSWCVTNVGCVLIQRALESDRGLVYQLDQEKPFNEGRFVAVQLNFWAATEVQIAFRCVSSNVNI